MLQSGVDSRKRIGDRDYRLDRFERAGDHAAAVAFSWTTEKGEREEWAQSLVLRDGHIIRIQDFADPDKAFKAIQR